MSREGKKQIQITEDTHRMLRLYQANVGSEILMGGLGDKMPTMSDCIDMLLAEWKKNNFDKYERRTEK